jgi:hypothetical protein
MQASHPLSPQGVIKYHASIFYMLKYRFIQIFSPISNSPSRSFNPFLHSSNQIIPKTIPYDAPASTCSHEWWPNQTLDTTTPKAYGTTTIGAARI